MQHACLLGIAQSDAIKNASSLKAIKCSQMQSNAINCTEVHTITDHKAVFANSVGLAMSCCPSSMFVVVS